MSKEFDPNYYAQTADQHGWGAETAGLDTIRSAYLREQVVGKSVLDVGCATGVYVDMLAKDGYEAHGVDFTKDFIDVAKKRYQGTYRVADAYKLPYKDRSIDTILLLDILEHLDDVRALKEAWRVAKKRVIVVVPNAVPPELELSGVIFRDYLDTSHLRYYNREMLEKLVKTNGGKLKLLQGVAPFDLHGLMKRTIVFRWDILTRAFFKLFFVLLQRPLQAIGLVKLKTYYSEWLLVIDR